MFIGRHRGYIIPMLLPEVPALILAPMEGVTDAPMRALQGESGAFTFAVSEFLRVSHSVPPPHVFLRHVPELRHGSRTSTGLPVQVQLLGGDPGRMAASAVVAHTLGATAIDINFGCPAPTVNRHDGGATLLKYPQRIREIVRAVRSALPQEVAVSAKMRLGWDTLDAIDENAEMVAEAGASWLTIHGRTRMVGYAPPIYWEPIGRVRERLGIPVVANGDIWTIEGFRRCREITGCRHFMLGRGTLANPFLANQVAAELGLGSAMPSSPASGVSDWPSRMQRLVDQMQKFHPDRPQLSIHRLKQWLKLAANHGKFAHFDAIKRTTSLEELFAKLNEVECIAS